MPSAAARSGCGGAARLPSPPAVGGICACVRVPFQELGQFIHNFDEQRMAQYELDGERAVWPHLPLIRSLCELEFALDTIARQLGERPRLMRCP